MSKNLQSLSKSDLLDLAKKKKIKMPYLYRKEELISMLNKVFNPGIKKTSISKKTARKIKTPVKKKLTVKSAAKKTVRVSAVVKRKPVLKPKVSRKKKTAAKLLPQPVQVVEAVLSKTQTVVMQGTASFIPAANDQHDLPYSYNKTKIVLLVRDPFWVFTYWDFSQETFQEVSRLMGGKSGVMKPVLRVYDVTDLDFNGKNAHWSFDVDVFLDARSWYVNVGIPSRSYLVDLGLLDEHGNFYLIARSNLVRAPKDGPSDVIDEQWMAVDFEEIYALSGGQGVGLSSAELRERKKIFLQQIQSSIGASENHSAGWVKKEGKGRKFFFEVETELMVYGRTEPDAKVTLNGQPLALRPDGTFSLRYYLPDGKKVLPIQAVSSDGVDTRSATIQVDKETGWK